MDQLFLYKVAFVAGRDGIDGITFTAEVLARHADEVDELCQSQVQPLQIAHFLYKNRLEGPRVIGYRQVET